MLLLVLFVLLFCLFALFFFFIVYSFVHFFPFLGILGFRDFYNYSRVWILCCYYNTSELGKTKLYGTKAAEIDQLSMNVWVWSRPVDFRIGFSLQDFCIFCITLSDFLIMDVLQCIVNPTCFIGCCDCNLFNLLRKTIVLIFNATHKIRCCKYWYCLWWYNLWCVELSWTATQEMDS